MHSTSHCTPVHASTRPRIKQVSARTVHQKYAKVEDVFCLRCHIEPYRGTFRPAVPGALGFVFGWLARPGAANRWFVLGAGDMAALKVFEGAQGQRGQGRGRRGTGGQPGRRQCPLRLRAPFQ